MPVKLGLPSNTNIAATVLCLLASWDKNILEFKVILLSLEARTDHLSFSHTQRAAFGRNSTGRVGSSALLDQTLA